MKPVSPVLPGENFEEIIVAEHQDEYQNLPVIQCDKNGLILSRWELSEEELKTIAETKSVWLFMQTFGKPVTPVSLQVEKPETETAPPQPDPEFEIMIAPRWSVKGELNAERHGLKISKKLCSECRMTTMLAESSVKYIEQKPDLKIICLECARKQSGDSRNEYLILKDGVQEIEKAILINKANRN